MAQPVHDCRRPKGRQDIDCKGNLQGSACGLLVCPCRGRVSSTRQASLFADATTSKVYSTLTAHLKTQHQGAGHDDLGYEHAGGNDQQLAPAQPVNRCHSAKGRQHIDTRISNWAIYFL
jgi:hypothetical protein